MSYRTPLGQTTPTTSTPATPAPASRPMTFGDFAMFGGIIGGFGLLIVGHAVGQHRLWTKEMKRNGRRRR